jgi:isopentenyl-diphosphate delta-isomerase
MSKKRYQQAKTDALERAFVSPQVECVEEVILVNANDQRTGQMEKLRTHQEGLLHRAVSVCLFDHHGRWLLQRRALGKYHSPGLWSNSCCSHPHPDETVEAAASRRVSEELGVVCPLVFCMSFIYKADVGNGLIEHEFDHLFVGHYDGPFALNPDEVEAVEWWETEKITQALQKTPSLFTAWFPIVFTQIVTEVPFL